MQENCFLLSECNNETDWNHELYLLILIIRGGCLIFGCSYFQYSTPMDTDTEFIKIVDFINHV